MNEVFHSNIQEGIRHYYDDLDFKNILDFVQEKFSCCAGDEFRDWEVNLCHPCNGSGALAWGAPHSSIPGLWLRDNFQTTLAIVCSLLLPQSRKCGNAARDRPPSDFGSIDRAGNGNSKARAAECERQSLELG
ncbi:tetraspanin-5-like [Geothlypis trichas]